MTSVGYMSNRNSAADGETCWKCCRAPVLCDKIRRRPRQQRRPFNLLAGVDVDGDRSTNGDRPLLIARNIGIGPNFMTFDVRLGRQFRMDESRSLELTFEAFNLFNRLNFSSVNNTVGPDPAGTRAGQNPDLVERVTGRTDRSPSQPPGLYRRI
jgi:outer membrane receptor for Fe3+-dicitrate